MSFWTGLEAITGHPAGAFSGMSMSDWFDNEKWRRMPRTWSGKMDPVGEESARHLDIRTNRATGEPYMTNWYIGGGGADDFDAERVMDHMRQDRDEESRFVADRPPYDEQFTNIMRNRYPKGSPTVSAASWPPNVQGRSLMPVPSNQGLNSIRQWGTQNPNVPGSMALDPTWAGGLRGAGLNAQFTTPPDSMSRPLPGVGRDRPFPIQRGDARPQPYTDREWADRSSIPRVPSVGGIPYGGKNPYRRPATLMDLPAGGRQRVPSLYDPYLTKLRSDQMGAAGFNPLERRMRQSRIDQEGLTTAGQYSEGVQSAIGSLGDAFLPANVMEGGREVWGDLRDFYYPGKDASSSPADKVTKIKKSADPTEYDTEEITITEKLLGPSGHRMGALKDTAADVWKDIREGDIIQYWMNQFRGN